MSNFQNIIIVIFSFLAVIGVLFFSGVFGFGDRGKDKPFEVIIWGTVEIEVMRELFEKVISGRNDFSKVSYIEKDVATYEKEFVEALAGGKGPDLFLLSQDRILKNQERIVEVSYASFSKRKFKDTFIEEGELYMGAHGIFGVPFIVDPMVMYWNRDIFSSVGVASPPQFWDELFVLSPKITQRDESLNIQQSLTALGEFDNIIHAKEILSLLTIQAGNPIVGRREVQNENGQIGAPFSLLKSSLSFSSPPAEAALRFYTEFSNPVKSVYSWNKALPDSRQMFISGDLAVYFGYASELSEIQQANPNLNFDASEMLQLRDSDRKTTFGNMSAFAIPKISKNINDAFAVANILTSAVALEELAKLSGLPPVRRDLLSIAPGNPYKVIFYNSALISKAWLDPDKEETDSIFEEMIESTVSGRRRLLEAIGAADAELNELLQEY